MHDNNNNVTTSKDTSGYYGTALAMLKDAKATVGDTVVITSTTLADTITHTGIIMPRYEHADDIHIVIKLKSGYNVGIDTRAIKSMIVKQTTDANMSKKK